MNFFLITVFLCISVPTYAADDNYSIETFEDRVNDAAEAQALEHLRSLCEKMGDCCVKASIVSLGLGSFMLFSTLFYQHLSFYYNCGCYGKEAANYERVFFSELLASGGRQCFNVRGCSYVTNEYEKRPHARCELPGPAFFYSCNGLSNVTLDNFGESLVVVSASWTAQWNYPEGCKKYINYDALCKKAKALRRSDLCTAAQVQQKRFVPRKNHYKK